jgi:hypothetical protein
MPVRPRLGAPTSAECYSARRSGAGRHQMSMGPRRPRNSNCGSCRNDVDRTCPFAAGEILRAAATVQENSTSPARARLQSLAATLTVSPTNVVVLCFAEPKTQNATSPKCSHIPMPASRDSSLRQRCATGANPSSMAWPAASASAAPPPLLPCRPNPAMIPSPAM